MTMKTTNKYKYRGNGNISVITEMENKHSNNICMLRREIHRIDDSQNPFGKGTIGSDRF